MTEWIKSQFKGLRYREHPDQTRGTGRSKRPLRYIQMVYKWQGKTIAETFGWEGETINNEEEAASIYLELKRNRSNRTPPYTLKERNLAREQELASIAAAEQAELDRIEREQRTRFGAVFSLYCEAFSGKKSINDEIIYFKNWINPAIGTKRLDEIGLLDLEQIKKKMEAAGRAPRSIQYIKSIVRQTYHYAIDAGLYSGDIPTLRFLKKQKFDNRRQRYLTVEEAEALLDEIRKHSEKTYRISLLSINSGLRFGEIASLRWQHINDDERSILVLDPKNAESRSVFMTEAVTQMFSQMKQGNPEELVFPARKKNSDSTAQAMKSISKVFDRAVATMGLNAGITDRRMKVVFHTLRHSCASWLVNSGVELPIIARILGHKSLTMTMRYAHINDQSVKGAMTMLDEQQSPSGRSRKIVRFSR